MIWTNPSREKPASLQDKDDRDRRRPTRIDTGMFRAQKRTVRAACCLYLKQSKSDLIQSDQSRQDKSRWGLLSFPVLMRAVSLGGGGDDDSSTSGERERSVPSE